MLFYFWSTLYTTCNFMDPPADGNEAICIDTHVIGFSCWCHETRKLHTAPFYRRFTQSLTHGIQTTKISWSTHIFWTEFCLFFFQLLKTSFNWENFCWLTNKKLIFSAKTKHRKKWVYQKPKYEMKRTIVRICKQPHA